MRRESGLRSVGVVETVVGLACWTIRPVLRSVLLRDKEGQLVEALVVFHGHFGAFGRGIHFHHVGFAGRHGEHDDELLRAVVETVDDYARRGSFVDKVAVEVDIEILGMLRHNNDGGRSKGVVAGVGMGNAGAGLGRKGAHGQKRKDEECERFHDYRVLG